MCVSVCVHSPIACLLYAISFHFLLLHFVFLYSPCISLNFYFSCCLYVFSCKCLAVWVCQCVCVCASVCVCVSPDTSLMQMCAPIVAKWKSETEPSLSRGDQPVNNRGNISYFDKISYYIHSIEHDTMHDHIVSENINKEYNTCTYQITWYHIKVYDCKSLKWRKL